MPGSEAFPILLASGGGFDPLALDWRPFLWAWGIFIALFLILRRFAWKPLLAAVEAREKRISDSLAKAEEVQRAAAAIAQKQEAALAEAHAKAKAVLDEARAQSEEFRKREMEKARQEADGFLERAKKEIALEENRARDVLRRDVVDLTIAAASQVLGRSLTGADEKRLAEQAVGEIVARRVGAGRN